MMSDRWAADAAWLSWTAVIVVVSLMILAGSDHTVVGAYRDAARQWFAGRDIYTTTGHGFLYLPVAAILFAPFAWLPTAAGEIAWRVLTVGSFAFGIRRLSTAVGRPAAGRQSAGRQSAGRPATVDLFPLMTLAALPPALACARNGQSTLIMTALMMLGCVEMIDGHRWRAALWLSLALAFKPLALVMILLAPIFDRRLAGRLFVGLAVVLLVPFLTESPHYVADQYAKSWQMVRASSLCGMTELWAQPFSVLSLVGINVDEWLQTAIRVAAAVGTAWLCREARRRHDHTRGVEFLFAFSVLYILLFNPRSENNTYAMLGPVIGVFGVPLIVGGRGGGRVRGRGLGTVVFLSLLLVVLSVGDELVRVLTPPGEHIWLKPILAAFLLAYLFRQLFSRLVPLPEAPPWERPSIAI